MEMEEGSPGGAAGTVVPDDAEAASVMARFSLDVSVGCGGRHSTLLDEYERLAFEAQLNRAIVLRRCYSEPSPVRFARDQDHPPTTAGGAPTPALGLQGEEAEARLHELWWFWRVHEAVARWLLALEPVLQWLRSAWERRRRTTEQAAARRPTPAVPPRVQLRDYLR